MRRLSIIIASVLMLCIICDADSQAQTFQSKRTKRISRQYVQTQDHKQTQTQERIQTQPFPFTSGTRINCRSEYGKTNNFYIVTQSVKTGEDCYTFEMEIRGGMLVNGKPSLDGYITGTWDKGMVKIERLDKGRTVCDIIIFEWTGGFFKSFFGFYAELENQPKQDIRVDKLPKDYRLLIDGCPYSGYDTFCQVSLARGIHKIKVTADGYENFYAEVDTRMAQESYCLVNYTANKGEKGVIFRFNNVPPSSILYIDGKKPTHAEYSSSPNSSMQMVYTINCDCPSGEHTYKITSPGFKDATGTIKLGNNGIELTPAIYAEKNTKHPLFIEEWKLASKKFYVVINGERINKFSDAMLNGCTDNYVAVYKKDGTLNYVENIYADKYNISISEWARYPQVLHKVRGVPENTNILVINQWGDTSKFARIDDCWYFAQNLPSDLTKWKIMAVKEKNAIFSANFSVSATTDDYERITIPDIVLDKSLVKDKWVVGDIYKDCNGKPVGIVVATTDGGEHGTILSTEEFKHPYVVNDGKRKGSAAFAADQSALFNLKHDSIHPKQAAYRRFVEYLKPCLLNSDATEAQVNAYVKKWFPAFYHANAYKVGTLTEWYLPNHHEMETIYFMSEFLNQKLSAAGITPLLKFENELYVTIRITDFVGTGEMDLLGTFSNRFLTNF